MNAFFYQITHVKRCKLQSREFTKAARETATPYIPAEHFEHCNTFKCGKKSWELFYSDLRDEFRWRGQRSKKTVLLLNINTTYLASILSWKDKFSLRHLSLDPSSASSVEYLMQAQMLAKMCIWVCNSCMFLFSTLHGRLRESLVRCGPDENKMSHLSTYLGACSFAVLCYPWLCCSIYIYSVIYKYSIIWYEKETAGQWL